jgi:hypothetical protein
MQQGPRIPHHSWVDYGGEHHTGMGNRTHNLLIGGHESLPPSQGMWCLAIITTKGHSLWMAFTRYLVGLGCRPKLHFLSDLLCHSNNERYIDSRDALFGATYRLRQTLVENMVKKNRGHFPIAVLLTTLICSQ